MSIVKTIKNHLINIPGWRTNRKIVVFESDDWGMIRMASKQAFEKLLRKGHPVNKSAYNKYDSLESNADIQGLMEILSSVQDKNAHPAKFTLNNIVTNPDFEKIKEEEYNSYHYELFTETLKKYENSDKVMNLYREGIENQIFRPQFHGREHLHVNNWLRKLQSQEQAFLDAFQENVFTVNPAKGNSCFEECLDSMATYTKNDVPFVSKSIEDGLQIFKRTWGFESSSIIAPCYSWHTELEQCFKENGVRYIQGARAQREPLPNYSKKIKRHFMGQKSRAGLTYLIRNVHFEQVENKDKDWVDSAMKEIAIAFFWKKPAIISTHRVNYIGSLVPANRSRNLKSLEALLKSIVQKFPTVEFMSSDELGALMNKN